MTQETKTIIGIGVVTIAMIAGAVLFLSKGGSQPANSNSVVDSKLLVREDSQKIATDSAKVTVVEFADFQCPACGVIQSTVKKVIEDYRGKINYVFRHFPLTQHQNALKAAEAAEAAGEQGKFWQMHDKLFEKQDQWSVIKDPTDQFVNYAKDLGIDTDKFKQAVDGNKFNDKIQKDQSDGFAVGVNSTPTFFINGQKLVGVPTYEDLKGKIDVDLNK